MARTPTKNEIVAIGKAYLSAKKAGAPKDQATRLIESGYFPFPWQWQFHSAARTADEPDGPVDIGAGGARGPGKSHVVLSQVALDDCQRQDRLKVLFLRQTGISAKESFDDLINKTVRGRTEYHKTQHSLRFPNGSQIILGGFKDESDIDKYIGIEYDIIIVEELNQLTAEKYEKLRGSLRTSKPDWRPRMYTSFNPGGVGHQFVRDRYVIPYRARTESETRFIPSTYKQNPNLNPEYIKYLESLTGGLGKAWREGEWDSFAGQYFDEWRYEKHVCEPFAIPTSWRRFRAIDPSGRSGTTVCHWYALDSNGDVWIYRAYSATGLDYDQHAEAISKLSKDRDGVEEEYVYTVMDTAAWAKAGYSETAVDIYERHGVTGLIQAAKERVVGWNAVHTYLRWDMHTPPKLHIFKNCGSIIKAIPLAQHDVLHPEDVASVWSGADHGDDLDALRYFLRTLREQKSQRPLTVVERHMKRMQEQEETMDLSYMRK
jgi:PBSX family phage terminase large subunit